MKLEAMKLKSGMAIKWEKTMQRREFAVCGQTFIIDRVIKHDRFYKEIALVGVSEMSATGWKQWPVFGNHDMVEVIR